MIDSHTHLALCDAPAAELVEAAVAAGVRRMLNIGIDGGSSRQALGAAEAFPQVFAAVGRHPNSATGFDENDAAELSALAEHPRCVAVGETGLDYHHDDATAEDQRRAFEEQAGGVRVVLHCFSMPDRLDECLEAGYWISFAGNVTYPSASALAQAAARVPAGRLLVETDAPYLTPVPRRGKRNTPAGVVDTARFVADVRGVSYEQLEQEVESCAAELFGW